MGSNKGTNGRVIGIRHRVKKTADGEARPTELCIFDGNETEMLELEDDNAELDFILGRFPVSYRDAKPEDDLAALPAHHMKRRKTPDGEKSRIPNGHVGLMAGDVVAMTLGGSGDRLAYALSRRAEAVGATVMRIPPFDLKAGRKEGEKDGDAALLARLAAEKPHLFTKVTSRDRQGILLRESLRAREDAMKARIGCEQRLRQQLIGAVFCREDGLFPEGSIEQSFDELKANDVILKALTTEERKRERELTKIVESLDVYEKVFAGVEGAGPMIAARLIAAIGDVRKFATDAKLKAFCGAHVLKDGGFARRRSGTVSNWSPTARQALYLLGDQFNRRPNSVWGAKLREYKRKFREKHPVPVIVDGKKRYGDGHIHRMATWRTLTKFVEWLWREWMRIERGETSPAHARPSATATE